MFTPTSYKRLVSLLILTLVFGCSGTPEKKETVSRGGANRISELWDACFMDGINAGYVHTRITPLMVDGEKRIETKVTLQLKVTRSG